MQWFDTGIEMVVVKGDSTKTYTFSGFNDRTEVFESLESIW